MKVSIQFSQELVSNFSTLCTPTIFYGSLAKMSLRILSENMFILSFST